MDKLCRDCKYYKHILSECSECRRFPPKRDSTKELGRTGYSFAKTTFDEWCGEFTLSEKNNNTDSE